MPTGDDLTVILFFIGLAVTLIVTAASLIERKRKLVIRLMFGFAAAFSVIGIAWQPLLKDIFPGLTKPAAQLVANPVSWFVIIMFLAAVLLFSKIGNLPPKFNHVINASAVDAASVSLVKNIVLAAGLTPQTTSPVQLIAKVVAHHARLRIVLEHSFYLRAIGSAGWTSLRQVVLADLKDLIQGADISLPVASCKQDGSEVWFGGNDQATGNLIQKSKKYRARIRFIDSNNDEQTFHFCLLRTSMAEPPYILEVFSEQDMKM